MEHFEQKSGLTPAQAMAQLLAKDGYRQAFAEFARLGWRGLRKMPADSAFSRKARHAVEGAKFAAQVIDFLYRFQPTKKRKTPSLAMAKKLVRAGVKKGTGQIYGGYSAASKTAAMSDWSNYQDSAIFAYLLLIQKHELQPHSLHKKDFVGKLFDQLRNKDETLQLIANYNAVVRELRAKKSGAFGYKSLAIAKAAAVHFNLPSAPMEPELIAAVDTYKSIDS